MPRRFSSALGTLPLVLALLLVAPAASGAKSSDSKDHRGADALARVQQLNRTAMQYFDDLNYALAEKSLLEALALVEKGGFTSGPAVLSTHGNLAVLYSSGLKQPDKAVQHFKAALALKPNLKLSKLRATPEAEANLARAKAEVAGGAAPGGASSAEGAGLRCPIVREAHAGEEVTFTCTTEETLPAAAVRLQYKANDGEDFQALQMTKEGTSGGVTTWVAKVPGSQTQAKTIPFFVEADDASGTALATHGREDKPNVVELQGAGVIAGPPPVTEAEGDEDEEEEEEEEIDDDNPLAGLERERRKEHQGSKGTWLVSGGGFLSGIGYAYGHRTEAFGKYGVGFNSGFTPATFTQLRSSAHLVWEVAYFVGRNTALSVGGRHQLIVGGPKGTATGANSLLVRSLFFTEDEGKSRWYFSLAAGGGEGFRLLVDASVNDVTTGEPTGVKVRDTVRGGPFLAGFGGGVRWKVYRNWFGAFQIQVLFGIPNFSVALDPILGSQWTF